MILKPIPAFTDNYIWIWQVGEYAVVVDPGDAVPVLAYLEQNHIQLHSILITHHHGDHIGGLDQLASKAQTVFLPASEVLTPDFSNYIRMDDGHEFELLGQRVQVIATPGHTLGHICYFLPDHVTAPVLFCGDTLFSVGCGRLFEGTASQMFASLQCLSGLPSSTLVCCAHEYTLSNIKFALTIEPENQDLLKYSSDCELLRQNQIPTVPANLAQECLVNPFLRAHLTSVQLAVEKMTLTSSSSALDTWSKLRVLKNNFR